MFCDETEISRNAKQVFPAANPKAETGVIACQPQYPKAETGITANAYQKLQVIRNILQEPENIYLPRQTACFDRSVRSLYKKHRQCRHHCLRRDQRMGVVNDA